VVRFVAVSHEGAVDFLLTSSTLYVTVESHPALRLRNQLGIEHIMQQTVCVCVVSASYRYEAEETAEHRTHIMQAG
jgi:hypothetical protein